MFFIFVVLTVFMKLDLKVMPLDITPSVPSILSMSMLLARVLRWKKHNFNIVPHKIIEFSYL
jgi:hypothetical protein